jgi:hypothetical protein
VRVAGAPPLRVAEKAANSGGRNVTKSRADDLMPVWKRIKGTVIEGYRVASGISEESPYPTGTIEMQLPYFLERGLDLRPFFSATIGVSCHPRTFVVRDPAYTFRNVKWSPEHHAEDFSFSACRVLSRGEVFDGFVYYPHPDTKIDHYHDASTLEIIAPFIAGIRYGVEIELEINEQEITIDED